MKEKYRCGCKESKEAKVKTRKMRVLSRRLDAIFRRPRPASALYFESGSQSTLNAITSNTRNADNSF